MRLAPLAAVPAAAAVALLAAGCGGPAVAAPAPSPSSHAGKAGHDGRKGVRGTVTAENGTTWTITTPKNKAVTVTLTPQTAFGTRKAPATAAQFPVGSQVRIAGTTQGDGVTATRIGAPAHPAAPSSATPAPAGPTA